MNLDTLREKVRCFESKWFPPNGERGKFWFTARSSEFYPFMLDLCAQFMETVETVEILEDPQYLATALKEGRWPNETIVSLAVMLDQMPRNALAVNFGRFVSCDPLDVKNHIDDRFSYTFALSVLEKCMLSDVHDERIICFFSLVFRHSNDFERSEKVLLTLSNDNSVETLPSLGKRFWNETQKRRNSLVFSLK